MWRRYLVWAKAVVLLTAFASLVFEAGCMLPVSLVGKNPSFYHDFLKMKLPSKYQCMELCVAFTLCRSVTYNDRRQTCYIHSDRSDRQFKFAGQALWRTQLPQGIEAGSCTTPSCRIDEMCVADATKPTCVKHGKSIVKCPEKSFRKDNTCFKLFRAKKTWNEARDFCVAEGSNLIEIHSTENDKFIATIVRFQLLIFGIKREGAFWTGLVYSSTQSAWLWDGSRDSLTYNMFLPTIPTNQDDMCMGVSYASKSVLREWKMVDCNTTDIFICQYESPDFWQ